MLQKILKKIQHHLKTDIQYFVSGGSWLLSGQALISVSSVILTVAFANLLSVDDYGVYKYILSFIALFSITSLGGINTAFARSVSRHHEGDYFLALNTRIRWAYIGALASAVTGVYYILQPNYELGISFVIAALFLPFVDSYTMYQAYLNGKSLYKQLSLSLSLTYVISAICLVATIYFTKNVIVIVACYFGVKTALMFLWSRYTIAKYPPNDVKDPTVIRYGTELSFMKGLATISGSIYSLGLWHFGGGATTLATFALAIAPTEQIRGALKYIEPLILPKTSKDSWKINTFGWFIRKTAPLTLVTIAITVAYIVIAPFAFKFLFPKYEGAIFFSQLYSVSLILTSMSIVVTAILKAKQKTKALHTLNFTSMFIDFAMALPAIYFFGVYGLIISMLIGKVIILTTSLFLLYGVSEDVKSDLP